MMKSQNTEGWPRQAAVLAACQAIWNVLMRQSVQPHVNMNDGHKEGCTYNALPAEQFPVCICGKWPALNLNSSDEQQAWRDQARRDM